MKFRILFGLLIVGLLVGGVSGLNWSLEVVDTSGSWKGQWASIAIDSNNIPHMEGYDADTGPSGALKYCNRIGGSWSCETILTGDYPQYGDIAIDSLNVIHISHQNSTVGVGALAYCTGTSGSWSCEVVDIEVNAGVDTAIAIDSSNNVHMTHYDATNTSLRYCTGSYGSWSCEEVDTTNSVGHDSSVVVETSGTVHISYTDATNHDLRYCTGSFGSWSCETVESTNFVGYYTDIALNSTNEVHIAHTDVVNGPRYCAGSAGSWSCEAVESGGYYSSIDIDSSDIPHIALQDSSYNLRYCNRSSSWLCEAVDSSGEVDFYKDIKVDSNSKVHIAYCNYQGADNELLYANATLPTAAPSDITPPNVTINTPTAIYYNTVSITLNTTVTDDTAVDSCWYSLNSWGTNTSYNCSDVVMTASEGSNTVWVGANDTLGNENTTESVTFTVDLTNPNVTIHWPQNHTKTKERVTPFNFTATDNIAATLTCYLYLDGVLNSTNSSVINGTATVITPTGNLSSKWWNFSILCEDDALNSYQTGTYWVEVRYWPFLEVAGAVTVVGYLLYRRFRRGRR